MFSELSRFSRTLRFKLKVITFEEKHGKRPAERHFGPSSIEETMSLEKAREKFTAVEEKLTLIFLQQGCKMA